MFGLIETLATAIILILLLMFVLHLIFGTGSDWIASKFQVLRPEESDE